MRRSQTLSGALEASLQAPRLLTPVSVSAGTSRAEEAERGDLDSALQDDADDDDLGNGRPSPRLALHSEYAHFYSPEASSVSSTSTQGHASSAALAKVSKKLNSASTNAKRPRPSFLRPNRSLNDLFKEAVAEKVSQKDVVHVFAEILVKVASSNEKKLEEKPFSKEMSVFEGEGRRIPKVSMPWYLWRLVYFLNKYPSGEATFFAEEEGTIAADFSPGAKLETQPEDIEAVSRGLRAFLLALIYIDRISEKHEECLVTRHSIHRMLLTAILIATKFSDDFQIPTSSFAKLGGITLEQMLCLEDVLLDLIDFNLNVTDVEFEEKCLRNLNLAFDICVQRQRAKVPRSQEQRFMHGSQLSPLNKMLKQKGFDNLSSPKESK